MTNREVMQQALNALDGAYHKDLHDDRLLTKVVDAKIALREALAQPEPTTPEGWKLVPIEPTDAMVDAMNRVLERHNTKQYLAALAAAPEYKEAP